jgi:hypothetical protein
MTILRRMPVSARVVWAVAARPQLWVTALRQARALAVPGSLTPSADYLAFRLATQYGDPRHEAEAEDVLSYLRWVRQWRSLTAPPRSDRRRR